MEQIMEALRRARIVPVIRSGSGAEAAATAGRLVRSGLSVVELTATTPDWRAALEQVRAAHPEAVIGLGTVLSRQDGDDAVRLGADFLVSPWPVPEVRECAAPFLEGGFTPAEVAAAAGRGIAKLFPAHVGGPTYLKSLMAVLPKGSLVMPTGGVKLDDAAAWLKMGAIAIGVGSDLEWIAQVRDGL